MMRIAFRSDFLKPVAVRGIRMRLHTLPSDTDDQLLRHISLTMLVPGPFPPISNRGIVKA
jgi:hypothetical protein